MLSLCPPCSLYVLDSGSSPLDMSARKAFANGANRGSVRLLATLILAVRFGSSFGVRAVVIFAGRSSGWACAIIHSGCVLICLAHVLYRGVRACVYRRPMLGWMCCGHLDFRCGECSAFGCGAWPRDDNCDHLSVSLLPQRLTHSLVHPLCALTAPSTLAAEPFSNR